MQCNIGKTDRMLRIGAGAVILLAGLATGGWWGIIGLVPLGTGLMRWCPLYVPLKIDTTKGCCGGKPGCSKGSTEGTEEE